MPLGSVTYPAEPVTCNKVYDDARFEISDDYILTFDYNTKFCEGKAKSVTVVETGFDEGYCKY